MHERSLPPALLPLAAAVLFGASTPLSKILVDRVEPVLLAGLLYTGSGLGLFAWRLSRSRVGGSALSEAPVARRDLPWLAGAILAGGVAAPILLLVGLRSTAASSASLLLNLEAVFTAGLAWWVFRESFDQWVVLGIAAITAGCIALSWSAGAPLFVSWGTLAIVAACLGWGIDNNLTRKVSAVDPLQVAAAKGLAAGAVNLGLAGIGGAELPGAWTILSAAFVGLIGYGASLVLFVRSLRHLGAARTVAYFSTAPFVGAFISILLLGDPVTSRLLVGGGLMAIGVWLHLIERHEHEHEHETLEHDHRHAHDPHHGHDHENGRDEMASHSHPHEHREWIHAHPHYPDIHHRHGHR